MHFNRIEDEVARCQLRRRRAYLIVAVHEVINRALQTKPADSST